MPRENRQVAWRAHYLYAKTVELTESRSWTKVGSRSGPFIPATALLVCAAYYVGANIGFILRFPSATPSVMWPPNAILTATLLLTPPRRWWVYLLAALPAHLVAEGLGAGWPAPLVLGLFATNCSEALVAAVFVRRFSDAPASFDTLPRVVVFIVGAGLLAPFASSFADAGVVTTIRDEPYWLVWRTRFFSNTLAELALPPAIVMLIRVGPAWIRSTAPARKAEAALLATTLVGVGVATFIEPIAGSLPGSPHTQMAFLLPFLLWASVRFGPGGASLSILTTTLIAIFADTHRRGPFGDLPLAESLLALQIFLSAVAIPFLCLAALMEERRRTQETLEERLRFEELLSGLLAAFVRLPVDAIDDTFETWLGHLGQLLRVDRITLLKLSRDGQELVIGCSWAAPGVDPVPRVAVSREFPGMAQRLLGKQVVMFSRPEELPAEAAGEADSLRLHGVRSNLTIPLVAGGRVLGSLAFVTLNAERAWPDELVQRLRLVAEVFADALAYMEAEDALRTSELMKSAILASLSTAVAVLDREGQVITVNEAWTQFAFEKGARDIRSGVSENYLDACRQAAREGVPHAEDALAGVQAVLERSRTSFALEYVYGAAVARRWFAMSVVPLSRPEGGAVVSHTEVTEQRRAELEAERSRWELAHFTRVSTMGELTASLAHELNQPLTGILTNAQAARRLLEATPPDLGEVQSILSDIVEDDKRAGEVIRRVRDLLRKDESKFRPLDLNALIRDMTKLLRSDAVIRNVTVTLDLGPEPLVVNGDSVQLQQVVLNLLLNAMEAMAESTREDRTIVVRAENTEAQTVHVSVQDAGPGLRDGIQDLVFEPFYTTKPTGMGMGLSIARSNVVAHAGLIWATNNPDYGATFHFALPLASARSV